MLQIQLLHPHGSSILSYVFIPSLELELRKKMAKCLTLKLWHSECSCPSVLTSSVCVQGKGVCAEESWAGSAAGGAEGGVLLMGVNEPLCPSHLLAHETIKGSPGASLDVYTYRWKKELRMKCLFLPGAGAKVGSGSGGLTSSGLCQGSRHCFPNEMNEGRPWHWVQSPSRGSVSCPWDHSLSWNQEVDASPDCTTQVPRCYHF